MIDQLKEHVNTYLAQHGTVIIETGDESETDLSLRTCRGRAQAERELAHTVVNKFPKLLEKAQKRAVQQTKRKMREQYQIAQVGATLAVRVFTLPAADCRPPFPSTEEFDGQELYQERRQDHGRRLDPFPGLNIGRPSAGLKHFSSQIASQRDQASMSYVIKCIKLLDYRRAIHV